MSSEDHIQSIKDIYSSFERGDIDTIMSKLADDVDWDHNTAVNHNVAYYVTCKGRLAVKERFFGAIAESIDLTQFDRHDFVASGDKVAVTYSASGTIKKTGKSYSLRGVHFWTFSSDGKVASYRSYGDTAVAVEAWRD